MAYLLSFLYLLLSSNAFSSPTEDYIDGCSSAINKGVTPQIDKKVLKTCHTLLSSDIKSGSFKNIKDYKQRGCFLGNYVLYMDLVRLDKNIKDTEKVKNEKAIQFANNLCKSSKK